MVTLWRVCRKVLEDHVSFKFRQADTNLGKRTVPDWEVRRPSTTLMDGRFPNPLLLYIPTWGIRSSNILENVTISAYVVRRRHVRQAGITSTAEIRSATANYED